MILPEAGGVHRSDHSLPRVNRHAWHIFSVYIIRQLWGVLIGIHLLIQAVLFVCYSNGSICVLGHAHLQFVYPSGYKPNPQLSVINNEQALEDALTCLGYSESDLVKFLHSEAEILAEKERVEVFIRNPTVPAEMKWCADPSASTQMFLAFPWDAFGPFVPLQVDWHCAHVSLSASDYVSFVLSILQALRPEFIYVTWSDVAEGIFGRAWSRFGGSVAIPHNLLIIGGGGVTHIPTLHWRRASTWPRLLPNETERLYPEYQAIFLGNPSSHPVRVWANKALRKVLGQSFLFGRTKQVDDKSGAERASRVHARSRLVVAPRGWGRNSFRLLEVLQAGLIPLVIHSDFPYLPYFDSIHWKDVGFAVDGTARDLADRLRNIFLSLSDWRVDEMRAHISSLRFSHFDQEAIMMRVRMFLSAGFNASDLRCGTFGMWRTPEQDWRALTNNRWWRFWDPR